MRGFPPTRAARSAKSVHEHLLQHSHTINGATLDGIDGRIVEVQARAVEVLKSRSPWSRAVSVSGLPRGEAHDLLTRIGAALARMGEPYSHVKIVLNFHPDGRGESLALPAAVAVMQAAGLLPPTEDGDYVVFGAIDVHGDVRHVTGALPLALTALKGQSVVCPEPDARQCVLAKAMRQLSIIPVGDLETAAKLFRGEHVAKMPGGAVRVESVQKTPPDFADIVGQDRAKRAAVIAAAGQHNFLMIGPPGSGKTLIANAVAGILPDMSSAEKVELTRIWSAAGLLDHDGQAVIRRPFRVVHHTATKQAVCGGGSREIRPGEVTLAHRGVLFLDEIAEFKPEVLDSMRQPMEDGCVRISRVHCKIELPCRFSLVAACNPCPCGHYPDCDCGETAAMKYQSRLSGPLLDRIDLKVGVDPVAVSARQQRGGQSTAELRELVCRAMERQRDRLAGTEWHSNADVPGPAMRGLFALSSEAESTITTLAESGKLSMRGADRMIKVARTIADLAGSQTVEPEHVREAADFSGN